MAALVEWPGRGVRPELLAAYRPRRRAVIEVTGPHGRLFVKAVEPRRVEALHRRHRMLTDAGLPTPRSLGWTDDGLLLLHALPGRTLRDAVCDGAQPLPSGRSIVELLDRLPRELCEGPRRSSWLDRVGHFASSVAAIAPEHAQRVADIAGCVHAEARTGPTVPVHGDFYESRLLVDGPAITGLLDVDGAGAGDRLDDLACLVGHLSVLAATSERGRSTAIDDIVRDHLAVFGAVTNPVDLRYRVAAVVISLIPGLHRVQHPHRPTTTARLVDLAERWLERARRARRIGSA